MPTLLYLHGFLSSPQSFKAVETQRWLAQQYPSWRFLCPQLPMYPEATQTLLDSIAGDASEPLWIVGSSLGGFWATYIIERYGGKAVLVNPSVSPHRFAKPLVGQTLKNYHSDATYVLTDRCVQKLVELSQVPIQKPEQYWLLVQTGDETLDYTEAVAKYKACRQVVEPGGDHSFQGFERFLPEIGQFFLAP